MNTIPEIKLPESHPAYGMLRIEVGENDNGESGAVLYVCGKLTIEYRFDWLIDAEYDDVYDDLYLIGFRILERKGLI